MDKQQERTKVYHGPDGWTILADGAANWVYGE